MTDTRAIYSSVSAVAPNSHTFSVTRYSDISTSVCHLAIKNFVCIIGLSQTLNLLVLLKQSDSCVILFLVSREGDCRQSHVFSFAEHCPNGVYSMVYDSQRTVLIAGSCASKEPLGGTSRGDSSTAATYGITVWRILSDTPYYKLVTDYETELAQVH